MKALIIGAVGATGMHMSAEPELTPRQQAQERAQLTRAVQRQRAAEALRNR